MTVLNYYSHNSFSPILGAHSIFLFSSTLSAIITKQGVAIISSNRSYNYIYT